MSHHDFKLLLHHISQNISHQNVKLMRFLCSDLIPQGRDLSQPSDFIQYLEDHGYIDIDDMSFLAEVLYRVHRNDLLKKLPGVKNRHDYEKNFMHCGERLNFSPYRLACFKVATQLTSSELASLRNYCKNEMSVYNFERSIDPVTFITSLQEEDLLSDDDLEFFHQALGILTNKNHQRVIDGLRGSSNIRSSPVGDFQHLTISQASTSNQNYVNGYRFVDTVQPTHDVEASEESCRFSVPVTEAGCLQESSSSYSQEQTAVSEATTVPIQSTSPSPYIQAVSSDESFIVRNINPNTLGSQTFEDLVDSDSYTIEKYGYCVIINNEKFVDSNSKEEAARSFKNESSRVLPNVGLQNREGSNKDVEAISTFFNGLGFKVRVHENLDIKEMISVLEEYSEFDHSDNDCFVCFIMTHGLEGCVYGVDGNSIGIPNISKLFKPDKCPSLLNKPKIFFFQACQGESVMEGSCKTTLKGTDIEHDSPSFHNIIDVPLEADFLIAHSTMPGYLAYRSKSEGSWFISTLVECLQKYHKVEDLLSILIKVNNEMSRRPLKQMPMPVATLRKKIFLTGKYNDSEKVLEREVSADD